MAGPGRNTSESRIHKTKQRRKHKTLCKSRSGTETLHGVSAGQTQVPTVAVETLNVLTRVCTVYEYEKMELENPPTDTSELISLPVMTWKRFAKELCILSDCERMTSEAEELGQLFAGSPTESDDTLSGKTKQERFDEQSCKTLREHMDVLSDGTPAEEVSRRDSSHCRGIKQAGLWTGRRNAHGNEPLRDRSR
ncbi:reverse transcriptase [Phytophthora megakarya]|uniref:Reverse transcriptase n=1 Tax=Phytophthora megakarya TaxID=4795 RepID=A0A225UTN7_9STRA|nr:reverse transcriptase [Phytophthora megakarya]